MDALEVERRYFLSMRGRGWPTTPNVRNWITPPLKKRNHQSCDRRRLRDPLMPPTMYISRPPAAGAAGEQLTLLRLFRRVQPAASSRLESPPPRVPGPAFCGHKPGRTPCFPFPAPSTLRKEKEDEEIDPCEAGRRRAREGNGPVDVMTGLMLACLDSASMHSFWVIW